MWMINIDDIPNGDLKRRKSVSTIIVNMHQSPDAGKNFTNYNYVVYDENKKVAKAGSLPDVYDTYSVLKIVNFILNDIHKAL
jgi:hypothetical protein